MAELIATTGLRNLPGRAILYMLAGSFLYGLTHGVSPDRAVRGACYLAMKVISQVNGTSGLAAVGRLV